MSFSKKSPHLRLQLAKHRDQFPSSRYELFDRNPIYLVRQSAKRRTPPAILEPAEIKALIDGLALRERTLVVLRSSLQLARVLGRFVSDNNVYIKDKQMVCLSLPKMLSGESAF
jgi:hypothetical protein